jgi:flagellar biosynthetic protein FlhB
MAEDTESDDRSEEPSEQKLQQAREDGQLPRSKELATFAVTMAGLVLIIVTWDALVQSFTEMLRLTFTFDRKSLESEALLHELFIKTLIDMLVALIPIMAGLVLAATAPTILVGGWNFTLKPLEPKFSKLNPMPGIVRMFSLSALMEAGKAILKSGLIGGVAMWVIWNERTDLLHLIDLPVDKSMTALGELTKHTFIIVVSAMIVLVVVDVPFQLWNFKKKLRMTKEEVKQEHKNSEGSPEVKGRIRQLQREAARRRMMEDIPKANVVVTNPTHYAVALQYEEGMSAPKVLAKGKLRVAARIMDAAKEHKITIMRAPPFARALYQHAEIGQEIPTALYTAAAQVLAYVFQLKHYKEHGGITPIFPDKLPVPPELDPDTQSQQDRPTSDRE